MVRSFFKIAAYTALFAGVHSLLATEATKKSATKWLGERNRNGLYRPLYNVLAVTTFGGLVWLMFRLPNRELYRVRGPLAVVMHSVQFTFLLYLIYGAKQIGFLRFAGVPNIGALVMRRSEVPIEPEGQGPTLRPDGRIEATGPFRSSRHPLNFGMLPLIWLMPRMTVNLAAFNLVTTVYVIVGSIHEELRLVDSYGTTYEEYRDSGVAFFVPGLL